MADNKNRKDKEPGNTKIQFNSYWVYGVIILVILALNIYVSSKWWRLNMYKR